MHQGASGSFALTTQESASQKVRLAKRDGKSLRGKLIKSSLRRGKNDDVLMKNGSALTECQSEAIVELIIHGNDAGNNGILGYRTFPLP